MDITPLDLGILKTIISNRKYALEFLQEGSENLLHPDLWRFTKIILDYIKSYKEIPTKKIILEKIKTSKNETLFNYVGKLYAKLEEHQYNELEYKPDFEKLKLRYQEHLLHNLKSSLDTGNLEQNINSLQKTLTAIKNTTSHRVYSQASLKDNIENFIERFKARRDNPNLEKGIHTGFTQLDLLNNGFKAPELIIIAGNTGAGKSSLMLSLAAGMYLQNNSVLDDKFYSEGNSVIFFSLEMPLDECADRLISYLSGVPIKVIKSTKLNEEQENRLNKTLKFIKNYKSNFHIVDVPKGATAFQVESIYNEYCEQYGKVPVVVVDYLNIMDSDTKDIENDWLKQAEISEQLYKIARVNDIVLMTGVQLNENGKPEKNNEANIGTFRIGRSKGILHPATIALMLEKRISEETHPTMNVHIIKNRRGAVGKFTIRKNLECCGFLNENNYNNETTLEGDISKSLKD